MCRGCRTCGCQCIVMVQWCEKDETIMKSGIDIIMGRLGSAKTFLKQLAFSSLTSPLCRLLVWLITEG